MLLNMTGNNAITRASLSYLQEDLRCEPLRSKTGTTSRIGKEVEVPEEQDDDLDDDPLVLYHQKKLPKEEVSIPVPLTINIEVKIKNNPNNPYTHSPIPTVCDFFLPTGGLGYR